MAKKLALERQVSELVRAWRRQEAKRHALIDKKHKDLNFVQRIDRAQLRKRLRQAGATRQQIDYSLEAQDACHRSAHQQIRIETKAEDRARIEACRKEEREVREQIGWSPSGPHVAIAMRDRRSLMWWDEIVSEVTDATLLEWLRFSHKPTVERPSVGDHRVRVVLPDFEELRALEAVAERLKTIGQSRDATMRKQLRFALVPPAAGRPTKSVDKANLADVRKFRQAVKTELQRARRDSLSDYAYRNRVEGVLADLYEDCPAVERANLLTKIASLDVRPSDGAARVAAVKFSLPLSLVRAGRVKAAKRTRSGRVRAFPASDTLDSFDHNQERGRRVKPHKPLH